MAATRSELEFAVFNKFVFVAALALAACGSDLKIEPTTLPNGAVGIPYSQLLTSTGDKPIHWHIDTGDVPVGINLLDDGTLSGTPQSSGQFSFTVRSTESGTLHSNDGTQAYTLTIEPKLTPETSIPLAQAGAAYSHVVQVTGGVPPYTINVKGLPAKFSFDVSTNTITGDPDVAGMHTLEIDVTDSGTPQQTASSTPKLTIKPVQVSIATSTLPDSTVGSPYSVTLQSANGAGPFAWSIVAGELPSGVDMAPDGVISGTPTQAQTYNFTVQVADQGSPPDTATRQLSITVN